MFSLFGEFSNQDGSEVRDTMIGWSYDNFRLLEQVFKVALDQRKTTLRVWLEKMANEHTPGDELTLYILARMYRCHIYVYTQMFWWTTLLYTLPVTEQELLSQCEIVLMYVKDRVYGKLDWIRGPVTKSAQAADTRASPEADSSLETVKISNVASPANVSRKTNPDITGSTNIEVTKDSEENVTTESAVNLQVAADDSTITKDPLVAESLKTGNVITENTGPGEDILPKLPNVEDTGRPKASLPGIGVFLNKTCTIPLVRCDFETIKTAVESREEPADSNNPPPSGDPGSPTLRTSSRKRTVIDYKKFLEEYADLPPSSPKRKREVDLKRRPSKSRMAAEKYRKTDFVTKPLNVPKTVHRRVRTQKVTPSTSADANKDVSSTQETITKPATTQETQDAIEALLLLGTMGMPPPHQRMTLMTMKF